MRQVCTEASNESFAGNSGFYEEKKDEEGRQEKGGPAESIQKENGISFETKRKSCSCHTDACMDHSVYCLNVRTRD